MSTDGTVRIKGLTFADLEQCKASTAVIVTCEEIVPEHYLRLDPDQNALPPFLVDAVVPVPYGAHPTACPYFYDYDPAHLNHYKAVAKRRRPVGGLAGGVGVRRRELGRTTSTRSAARSWRASAPTPSPATRPAWTGGERDGRATQAREAATAAGQARPSTRPAR